MRAQLIAAAISLVGLIILIELVIVFFGRRVWGPVFSAIVLIVMLIAMQLLARWLQKRFDRDKYR